MIVSCSTILRGGYGIAYSGRQIIQVMETGGLDAGGGTLPGLSGITGGNGLTYMRTDYWALSNLRLPFEPQFAPLTSVSLTAPRTLTMNMYDPNRRVPYIQNFNLSIQRELARDIVFDVSYVGSKGTKLYGRLPLNAVNIYDTRFEAEHHDHKDSSFSDTSCADLHSLDRLGADHHRNALRCDPRQLGRSHSRSKGQRSEQQHGSDARNQH